MDRRYSQDTNDSIVSSESSARSLRRSLHGEIRTILRPYHPHATALVFEDPDRLEVLVVLGYDPDGLPVLPGSRTAVLETVRAADRPAWWADVVELWKLLGSPGHIQLSP